MTSPLKPLAFLLLVPLLAAAPPQEDYAAPYRVLQQASLTLDPSLAASAYASDGKLVFEYPGQPVETFDGRDAIRSSYVRTFGQVGPGSPIKIQFRFEPPGLASDRQIGAYRIDASAGGRPITVYGRFSVRLVKENGAWRFLEDRGVPATADDFERLPAAELGGR
jgi:hypothetical protein